MLEARLLLVPQRRFTTLQKPVFRCEAYFCARLWRANMLVCALSAFTAVCFRLRMSASIPANGRPAAVHTVCHMTDTRRSGCDFAPLHEALAHIVTTDVACEWLQHSCR